MPRPRHYSPAISRFLVAVLYHEAKAQRIPMTKLINKLLERALIDQESWQKATASQIQEKSAKYAVHN